MIVSGLGGFQDIEQLTVFPDYRLPQLFRALGIIELGPALSARIDRLSHIPKDSAVEIALRAATVVAGDRLRKRLQMLREGAANAKGKMNPTATQLDYHLVMLCILVWNTLMQ